jgi:nicotinamidase-related amidase
VSDPWLVVVDMQRVFADAEASPWGMGADFDAIVPNVRALVDAYEGRVVMTRFVAAAEPQGAWVDYYRDWPFALEPSAAPLWDVVDALAPAVGVPVVDAPTFGKWGPELLAATGGSRHLDLCGVSTDCCVITTALAAADDGCWVRVASDACAGVTPDDHQRALDAMAMFPPQLTITTTATLLA